MKNKKSNVFITFLIVIGLLVIGAGIFLTFYSSKKIVLDKYIEGNMATLDYEVPTVFKKSDGESIEYRTYSYDTEKDNCVIVLLMYTNADYIESADNYIKTYISYKKEDKKLESSKKINNKDWKMLGLDNGAYTSNYYVYKDDSFVYSVEYQYNNSSTVCPKYEKEFLDTLKIK